MTPKEENVIRLNHEETKLAVAQQDFVLSIKRAKRSGVDVAGIFLEVEEKVALARVRAFGLMLGIFWVMICPILIPLYKVWCFNLGMVYDLPEMLYYWPCIIGIVSIIAFGFDLVDPRTLSRLTKSGFGLAPKAPEVVLPEEDLTRSGNFLIGKKVIEKLRGTGDADGDV